jgi:hypothetical protein
MWLLGGRPSTDGCLRVFRPASVRFESRIEGGEGPLGMGDRRVAAVAFKS